MFEGFLIEITEWGRLVGLIKHYAERSVLNDMRVLTRQPPFSNTARMLTWRLQESVLNNMGAPARHPPSSNIARILTWRFCDLFIIPLIGVVFPVRVGLPRRGHC